MALLHMPTQQASTPPSAAVSAPCQPCEMTRRPNTQTMLLLHTTAPKHTLEVRCMQVS
jgi:hypothetical protein